MTKPSRESKEAGVADSRQDASEMAADGLRMADLSLRAFLDVTAFRDLPGVDPALLNPLASLPPHVTLGAAIRSFAPAIHKVDKPGIQDQTAPRV